MSKQVFIDREGNECQAPRGTTTPSVMLRLKNGVLQQMHWSSKGGRYWINVLTVADDAPDVTGLAP